MPYTLDQSWLKFKSNAAIIIEIFTGFQQKSMATEAIVGDFSAPEPRERRHHDHPSHRVLQLRAHDHLRRVHLRLQRTSHGQTLKYY